LRENSRMFRSSLTTLFGKYTRDMSQHFILINSSYLGTVNPMARQELEINMSSVTNKYKM
jgi:hypothetical protein